jgi:hypothetical protein
MPTESLRRLAAGLRSSEFTPPDHDQPGVRITAYTDRPSSRAKASRIA